MDKNTNRRKRKRGENLSSSCPSGCRRNTACGAPRGCSSLSSCSSLDNIIQAAALLEQCDKVATEENEVLCLQTMLRYQQCLFLLRHAYECTHESSEGCPTVKHCGQLKILCGHVMTCRVGSSCAFPHCGTFRAALEHYAACDMKLVCAVCGPFVSSKRVDSDKVAANKSFTEHAVLDTEDELLAVRRVEREMENDDRASDEACTSEEDVDTDSSPQQDSSPLSTLLNVADELYASTEMERLQPMKTWASVAAPLQPVRGNVHDANQFWLTKSAHVITPKGVDEEEGFECPLKSDASSGRQKKRLRFADDIATVEEKHHQRRLW